MSSGPSVPVPPGFEPFGLPSRFVERLGPLYVDRRHARLGLVTTDRLANIGGVVHGGALATLADVALFVIAGHGKVTRDMVTLTLASSYLAPAPLGAFVVAEGRVARAGRSVVFVDGQVVGEDAAPLLTFSGTIKRVRPARAAPL